MLDDKYRIESLLAVGGMGAVYVGTHIKLRKKVAIKILNPQLSTASMIARFHREAITASQIGHEGIAQVTDLGTSSAGEAFLVMELLEGESLASRLKATGPMPVELACELGCSILSPLAAAHHAGIVHRDLKPDNVFLVRQSRGEMVKLLDFGISRATSLEDELRLTNTGVVMGTPYYMSPEQARGDNEVGPASDLYAFGVILYEMLVGRVPITGENYNQLIYHVMTGEYARPRAVRPEIPEALEELIVRAMALVPEGRPASAEELEHALLAFCRPTYREHMIERISSPIPFGTPPPFRQSNPGFGSGAAVGSHQGTDPTLLAPSGMVPTPSKSKLPLILGVLVLVGVAGGVLAALQGAGEPATPTSAAPAPAAAAPAPAAAAPAPAAAAPAPAPVAPVPPPAPSTITLRFAIEPAHATIALDGTPITGTEHVVAKDDAEHELTIRAPGFVAHTDKLRFDESQRLVINLERTKPTPRTRPTRPSGAKQTKRPDRIESQSPYE